MTGIFSTPTPEKCNHYARFMQHLGRHEAEAIFWTLLNQWKTLRDAKLPPWPTALGTPVLVIAGFGHGCWVYLKSARRKFRGKDDDNRSTSSEDELRMSRT
jgi:hypothetical protein